MAAADASQDRPDTGGGAVAEPAADSAAGSAAEADATKRRFREALERKQAGANGGASRQDAGRKQTKAHGQAGSRREFRRKSG